MNSVVAHFRDADFESIKRKLEDAGATHVLQHRWTLEYEGEHIFLDRYTSADFEAEYNPEEKHSLISLLGGKPASSLTVTARDHQNIARFALEFTVGLLRNNGGVLDDDYGRLWQLGELEVQLEDEHATIFNLHQDAR